jgi:hypothetical protein
MFRIIECRPELNFWPVLVSEEGKSIPEQDEGKREQRCVFRRQVWPEEGDF